MVIYKIEIYLIKFKYLKSKIFKLTNYFDLKS